MTASATNITSEMLGVDVTRVDTTAEFEVGTKVHGQLGSGFIYLYNDATAITAGQLCVYEADYLEVTAATTAGVTEGQPVVVAHVAVAASSYAWFQFAGVAEVDCLASAAAGAQMNTTTTAGAIDDDATVGSHDIDVWLTETIGGSPAQGTVDLGTGAKIGVAN